MDPLMQQLLQEVRALREDTTEIKVTLAEQHVTLLDHTRRSTVNEEGLKETRAEVRTLKAFTVDELHKFKLWTAKWAGAWTLIGALGVVTGIIFTAGKIIGAW